MTHRLSLFLLALAVISAAAIPLSAHNGDRLFPILYLSEETLARIDLGDGSVEDWVDAIGEPTFTPLDFRLVPSGSYDQFDPSNLDFRIWIGWSQDGKIHVAGEFVDDVYVNEYDPLEFPMKLMAVHDHLGFQVDGDHTGGDYFFFASHGDLEEALKTNRQAQNYRAISHVPSGPRVGLDSTTDTLTPFEELELDKPIDWMVLPPTPREEAACSARNPPFGWSNSSPLASTN